MQPDSESEQFVLFSGRTVLECGCGERVILLGLEGDWYQERRTAFECECGEELTLVDSIDEEPVLDEEALGVRELLRSLRTPGT